MTVRRLGAAGNTTGRKSGLSEDNSPQALLSLRAAVILVSGLVVGVITGFLTYFPMHTLAGAIVAGASAGAGAIRFLNTSID